MGKNNKYKKILTFITAFLLLSTIFTASTNSEGILSHAASKIKEKINNIKNNLQTTNDTLKEKTITLKNTIEKIRETSHKLLEKNNKLSFIKNFLNILKFRKTSSTSSIFTLYTNYGGNEKTTTIRLGVPTSIDIDDDGDKDIKASFKMYPFIEKPLILTLNFNLKITRLPGFENPNEFFETYLEFHFLGILNVNNTGDKVKFGYQSKKGFKIPNTCQVTYKYLPYLFYLHPPKHKISFNSGIISDKEPLALIFGYDNAENITSETPKYSSKSKWTIYLDPAIKTEITFGGSDDYVGRQLLFESSSSSTVTIFYQRFANNSEFNAGLTVDEISTFSFEMEVTPFKKGGGRIEYLREDSKPVDVSLFFEKNNSIYFYIKDIPQHVKLSWTPETDGLIELNTFGGRISEAGIRDTLPSNPFYNFKAFLKNLPSLAQIKWNWEPFNGGEINVFCEQTGCSAHIIAHNLLQTGTEIIGDFYTNNNIDMSFFWDFSNKSFGIKRTNTDVTMDLQIMGPNGTSFELSTSIKNTINGPFQIKLGELFDGKAEITFTSNILELYDFTAELGIPSLGRFIVKMSEMTFNKEQSGVEFRFSTQQKQNNFTLNIEVEVFNGITIRGLMFGYNDFLYPVRDISNVGHQIHKFSITATNIDVDFWISEDGSSGYVYISGGLIVTFDSTFERPPGKVIGIVYGSVCFDTTNGYLNISWDTVDGQTQLNIDADGVASLSGFRLWVNNKIDINIPSIVGEFTLNTREKTGEVKLYLDSGTAALATDFNIEIINLMNVSLNADISLNFDIGLSGFVGFAWSEGTLEYITGGGVVGYNGVARITGLYFKYDQIEQQKYIELSASKITIDGSFGANINLTFLNNTISEMQLKYNSDSGTSIEVLNLAGQGLIDMDGVKQLGVLSLSKLEGELSGEVLFSLQDKYFDFDGAGKLVVNQFKFQSGKIKIYASVDISGNGEIIGDLNNGFISFDVAGDIAVSVDTNYPTPLKASLGATIVSAKGSITMSESSTTITLSSSKDLRIRNAFLNYGIGVTFKELFLRLMSNSDAVISFTSSGITLNANITSLLIDKLEIRYLQQTVKIDGEITFSVRGPLMIKFDSTSGTVNLNIWLPSGVVKIENTHISYVDDSKNLEINGGWNKLDLHGGIELIVRGSTISAAGSGDLIFDGLNLDVRIDEGNTIHIGYFKLDLDNVKGSVLDLTFGETININSASLSGGISELILEDCYIRLYLFSPPIELDIQEARILLSGSGYLDFELTKPNNDGIQQALLDGELAGDSTIDIDLFSVGILGWSDKYQDYFYYLKIDLDDFHIAGPTTFHFKGEGSISSGMNDIKDLSISVGADTQWSIADIKIYGLIEFVGFAGIGDLNIGVDIPGSISESDNLEGYLVIDLNGQWVWDDLILLLNLTNGIPGNGWDEGTSIFGGEFNGDSIIKIDIRIILVIFGNPPPVSSNVLSIDASSATTISFGEFTDPHNICFWRMMDIYLEPGYYSIAYDITSGIKWFYTSTNKLTMDFFEFKLINSIFEKYEISVSTIELNAGEFSLLYHVIDEEHKKLVLESTGSINPKFDLIKITNTEIGKSIVIGAAEIKSCPYLEIQWDIDLFNSSPDFSGGVYVNTDDNPIYFNIIFFDMMKIGGVIRAKNFSLSWGGWNPDNSTWINRRIVSGTLNQDCTIDVYIQNAWRRLWPFGSGDNPIANAGGPYSSPDCPATITFDFSGSHDANGDPPAYMRINWGHDVTWDTGWIPFDPHPEHTYYVARTYILKLQVKDSSGAKSSVDSTEVTIGTGTVIVEGYVRDNTTNRGIGGATVQVAGTQYSAQTNTLGWYWLQLTKGVTYTLEANADGYKPKAQVITPFDNMSNVNFYLDPGNMEIEVTWDGKEDGELLYENDIFFVYVKDEVTGDPIYKADVTYQYIVMGTPQDIETKQTTVSGKVSFTAVEVDIGKYALCQVKVSHSDYQIEYSDRFKVWDWGSGNRDPSFISGVSDKIIPEGTEKLWFISAYDPDGDYLSFTDLTTDYDSHGKCSKFQQINSNTLWYGFEAPYDSDTSNHYYNIIIKVTDGNGGSDTAHFTITVNDSGSCFLAGTKITMADGSYKNIEEIEIGDYIKSYDLENDKIVNTHVTKVYHHFPSEMPNYYLKINNKIRVTPNHPIIINNEWKHAGEIQIGDNLLDINGENVMVYSVVKIYEKVPTYNLELEEIHTYFADGIVAHNGVHITGSVPPK